LPTPSSASYSLESGDSSAGEFDASGDDANGWDAAIADGTVQDAMFDVQPAPTGLAGFAFVVNGVVQQPMTCTGAHWEFPIVDGEMVPASGFPPIRGISSVVIVNTGALPMPYLAQSYWSPAAHSAVPGGATGMDHQLAGVLQPGQQVDITAVYLPGIVALVPDVVGPTADSVLAGASRQSTTSGASGARLAATMFTTWPIREKKSGMRRRSVSVNASSQNPLRDAASPTWSSVVSGSLIRLEDGLRRAPGPLLADAPFHFLLAASFSQAGEVPATAASL